MERTQDMQKLMSGHAVAQAGETDSEAIGAISIHTLRISELRAHDSIRPWLQPDFILQIPSHCSAMTRRRITQRAATFERGCLSNCECEIYLHIIEHISTRHPECSPLFQDHWACMHKQKPKKDCVAGWPGTTSFGCHEGCFLPARESACVP